MKKYIIFLILLTSIVNYLYSFDKSNVTVETGNFYFLVGTEGDEKAIMYLNIVGDNIYGSYYTKNQSIEFIEPNGFDGRNLKLSYRDDNDRERTITGTLSGDIVFSGKHNSKNVNLSLANTTINTMKIFSYNYGDYEGYNNYYNYTEIIHPKDYDERKLINYYNSIVESYVESYKESIIEYGIEYGFDRNNGSSQSISYIDDRIIIIHDNYNGETVGGVSYNSEAYNCYTVNSKFEYSNAIELSDFIANPKDRRLLSLIRDKFYQSSNWNEEGYTDYDFDSLLAEEGGIENYDFLISPQGIIKILFAPYDPNYDMYFFEAAFTFEELKPYIKRGSPLDYLFN